MDIDTEIEVAIKGHSSPTIGRGIPHEGQAGYIVYEGEMPGLVAAIKRACNAFKIDDALSAARRFYASDVAPLIADRDRLAAEVKRLAVTLGKERDAWRELYSRDLDPPVCRLQVPDGWVPGNAREAAEGWHAAYGQISTERAALKTERDRLAAEVERLTEENEELNSTWPEWAKTILKMIRAESGSDGLCDDDGIDIPNELEEQIAFFNGEIKNLTKERDEARSELAQSAEAIKVQNGVVLSSIDRCIAAEKKLPCGHHHSLALESVESDTILCELCEARSERNDAVKMEAEYRAERDRLTAEVERLAKERDAVAGLLATECDDHMRAIRETVADRDRLAAEVERLAVTLGKERGEALDAAESILRYTPQISTNCNGTKPGMTTQHALGLVRDALAKLDAPNAPAPRPVTDDEVRAALGLYRHDADPGASVRSMRAALEQFAKGREG